MDRCARLLVAEPELMRGRWLAEFRFRELHAELGCGKGAFTVGTAKADPDVFIAAIEKSAVAMITALERADAIDLRNVRFINKLAEYLSDFFAPGEVTRIYINFCDPWPANRHVKRRLTHRRFLEQYAQVLRPGGDICFKTDNLQLFEYSLREFECCGFEPLDVAYDLHKNGPVGLMTDYEMKFHDQGLPIYYARATLCTTHVQESENRE